MGKTSKTQNTLSVGSRRRRRRSRKISKAKMTILKMA